MANIINLGLRGLQVGLRVDRVRGRHNNINPVSMDAAHHRPGRQYHSRCHSGQSIHHQLRHVCCRLRDAVTYLPYCGDNQ